MKKRIQGLFLFFMSLSFASAQPDSSNVTNDLIRVIQGILTPFFEVLLGTSSYDDFFFAKILFFLLLFIVIFTIFKKVELFEKVEKLIPIISLIISLLAVRYISEEGFFSGILLPYTTLGISIITFLPFLIYFWFVHTTVKTSIGRRFAWILYGLVFILLWGSRRSDLTSGMNWIYFLGIVIIGLIFLLDKNIHEYFGTAKAAKLKRGFILKQIADIEADLTKYRSIIDPSGETKQVISKLEERHRELRKEI
jgi:hypothetical protein